MRRNDRGLHDVGIGHADGFRHDERDGAHDRRHDLAAHRGGRLDAARECRPIAETLHQRNGELAGRDDIGDARPGNRSHQRRGEHRDLGGAALSAAEGAHGDVGEQPDHAGPLQERAEQDEQEDVGGGDGGGDGVDALGAEGHVLDHLLDRIAAMVEGRGQILAEQAIGEEEPGDDRQRRSHGAPDQDEQHHQRGDADDEIGARQLTGAIDEVEIKLH